MRNTYQDKHGTFYLRLFVPKILLPHISKPKIVQSLRTKDRRQAYLRSMEASLAFEKWIRDMKNKFGIGDDNRELIVTLPNGTKLDFDLEKVAEKAAYDEVVQSLLEVPAAPHYAPKIPEQARESTPLPKVPEWATRARLMDLLVSYKIAKGKTFAQATQDAYFPRIQKFIDFYQAKGIVFADEM